MPTTEGVQNVMPAEVFGWSSNGSPSIWNLSARYDATLTGVDISTVMEPCAEQVVTMRARSSSHATPLTTKGCTTVNDAMDTRVLRNGPSADGAPAASTTCTWAPAGHAVCGARSIVVGATCAPGFGPRLGFLAHSSFAAA